MTGTDSSAALFPPDKVLLFGILNVTPDSFSDGGRFLDPGAAADHGRRMMAEGADYIDIGAESTRPGSSLVPWSEEWARLEPVLSRLRREPRLKLSVDTSKYEVMERALDLGAKVINDVYAMRKDERIGGLVARHGAGIILMHLRGDPLTMQKNTCYQDLVHEVGDFLAGRIAFARSVGIAPGAIAADPGFGFGKSVEGNFEILRRLGDLRARLGVAVMAGLSRKSFIQKTVGAGALGVAAATAALHWEALRSGARLLRVHDIIEARQVIAAFEALRPELIL